MYEYYKPLRNFVRQLDRNTALLQIFQFFQNIQHDKPLPEEFRKLNSNGLSSLKGVVYQWELDILAREVILHSGRGGTKSLFSIRHFRVAIEHIRRLQDRQIDGRLPTVIYQELHRLFQQQFPWQSHSVELRLCRYLRIYRDPEVESLLVERTGLTVRKFYILGGAVTGAFLSRPFYNLNTSFKAFDISDAQRDSFFNLVSMDLDSLQKRALSVQEYNENWSYTINPLRSTPLVSLDGGAPNVVICPIPEFMLLRISEGLFFDLLRIKGFENPYGAAFERYVGEISLELSDSKSISVKRGEEYFVKKNKKNGVDWYVFDDSAVALIECKAKGMKLGARYQLQEDALVEEVDLLAKFVVQNYKNLADVRSGFTKFEVGDRAIYPVVVTLSNWYLFGPSIFERLESSVISLLDMAGLDRGVVEEYPYTIMSIEEYEVAVQLINKVGLKEFFDAFGASEHKGWMLGPFMHVRYQAEMAGVRYDYLRSEITSVMEHMEGRL
ncbi:hypothetical protein [Pseudomonas sp. N2-11]|uniref:hypothetical protein n=1 Tax=Pseudomonas sp. N2-11 TaxID=2962038 RepID=UPI0020B77C81|nr:hypothetical protein [Pseudomonas sp. N2-11]MCP3792287.1 hypothetical protein [Pseudomonas sp. N2-11]